MGFYSDFMGFYGDSMGYDIAEDNLEIDGFVRKTWDFQDLPTVYSGTHRKMRMNLM